MDARNENCGLPYDRCYLSGAQLVYALSILYMLQLPSLSLREGELMEPITMIYPFVPPPLQSSCAAPRPPHWQVWTGVHQLYAAAHRLGTHVL